jgi:predicted nucleic acid-binding protein
MDVFNADPEWAEWSIARLDEWSRRGPLFVNPIVYAELGSGFESVEALNAVIDDAGLRFEEMPRDALFLAAKAHLLYRRRRGARHGVVADFFIGAHAAVRQWPILTRDARRYRGYFPTVELVTPD